MTVASNQPAPGLADDVENLVVKNAQPKKVDGRPTKHTGAVNVKVVPHPDKGSHLAQPERKTEIKAGPSRAPARVDLGFPYKARVPEMRTKTSIPDAPTMRSEIDAFLRGDSTVLRGYDAL
jgi:hypothetical protein